jgi:hypothetical protein
MAENAFVVWVEHPAPWEIEQELLKSISCPLNIADNAHHPFVAELKRIRIEGLKAAREAPIASEHNQMRSTALE